MYSDLAMTFPGTVRVGGGAEGSASRARVQKRREWLELCAA